jgi:hypothetical protein
MDIKTATGIAVILDLIVIILITIRLILFVKGR